AFGRTEHHSRQHVLSHLSAVDVELPEVPNLVLLGPQPVVFLVAKDDVEQHQSLDEATERRSPSIAAVGQHDRFVERLVMEVVETARVGLAWRNHPGVAAVDERPQKVAALPAMCNAREA